MLIKPRVRPSANVTPRPFSDKLKIVLKLV